MRLNGGAINSAQLNAGVPARIPKYLAGDAIAAAQASLSSTRIRPMSGDMALSALAYASSSATRFGSGSALIPQLASLNAAALRIGSGQAVITGAGDLYYTRLIYGSGGGLISIIAISDIGVVYGEGSSIITPMMEVSGVRRKTGFGDAISVASGVLSPSAYRIPSTHNTARDIILSGELDTATIKTDGKRRINVGMTIEAYVDVVDSGMRRQSLLGSMDMVTDSYGIATCVRNTLTSTANIQTSMSGAFQAVRSAAGSGIISTSGSLNGGVYVRGDMSAVITIGANLTGYVYHKISAMDAVSSFVLDVNASRKKIPSATGPITFIVTGSGCRGVVLQQTELVTSLIAQSTASDYDIDGLDTDVQIFFRAAVAREFARTAAPIEFQRS